MDWQPYHEPNDDAKLADLMTSMERHGWVGAPLVAWDTHLLTGAHRFAAVDRLSREDRAHIDMPVVDIRDVFAACGLDFDALVEHEGITAADDPSLPWLLHHYLPRETRAAYGIDIN